MGKYRQIGIKVFIFLLILPFLTITDFYPFMRFGMFAEPIKTGNQLELYRLAAKREQNIQFLDTDGLGLSEGQFNYISRTYVHTHRSQELLRIFWGEIKLPKDSLFLVRIHGQPLDSSIVAKYAL